MHKHSLKHYHSPTKLSLSTTSNATIKTNHQSQLPLLKTHSVDPECILFPTYAFRDPSNMDGWIVCTKGWALYFKKPGPKQRVLKGITKSVAGKGSASTHENANEMFEERFKYFMATGKRNKKIEIEAIGAATNAEWIQLCNSLSLKSPLIPPPYNDLSVFRLPKQTLPQLQDIYIKAKQHIAIVIHDDVTTLPILFNAPYVPTSMASDVHHRGANNSSDEDDEEEDSSCDETILDKNGITLISERTGVFEGQFRISEQQVDVWTHNNNELVDKRMIKIRSQSKSNLNAEKDFCFPPSYGIVQLIEPYGVSIISDVDDTIKVTGVLSGARTVLSNTFINPTRAIPGMADAYTQWYNHGASYHYVSNSPIQLAPMLHQFITQHQFPPGSFHLGPNTGIISKLVQESGRSKRESICKLLRDFPHRKFVLVGDSGEIDIEIYTRIAKEFPAQILKIFIRDVTTMPRSTQAKKRQHMSNIGGSAFPAFFSPNFSGQRTESAPDLPSTITHHDHIATMTECEDDDTASKLADRVLKPTLTTQTTAAEMEDIPADDRHHHHQHQHQQQQPWSHSLLKLFARLAIARRSVKGLDIVLFKESKELYQNEEIMYALAKYKNSKEQNQCN